MELLVLLGFMINFCVGVGVGGGGGEGGWCCMFGGVGFE